MTTDSPTAAPVGPTADGSGHGSHDRAQEELTAAEQRMWVLHTMTPDDPAYTVASGTRVRGPLDPARLRRALARLAGHHPTLRSTFEARDGRPVRLVAPAGEVPLDVADLGPLPPEEAELRWRVRAAAETARTWDLSAAPPYRVTLLSAGPLDHLLVASFHHIIVDGWSIGVFHRDLGRLYAEEAPAPVRTPAETVRAEHRYLESTAAEEDLAYWRRQLADLPELHLGIARTGPGTPAQDRARRFEATLSAGTTRALETAGRRRRLSLYMVTGAAFAALLHRYSGQRDIVFGSPLANRTAPGEEDQLGLFVNSAVLRTAVSPDTPFAELAEHFGRTALAALEHQRYPFERLVADLAPGRDGERNPLFQAMFTLQNAAGRPPAFPGSVTEPLRLIGDSVRIDLECTLWPEPDGLRIAIAARGSVVPAEAAERMLEHFVRLLHEVAEDFGRPVGELALLGPRERAEQARAEQARGPAPAPDTLPAAWLRQVRRSPGAVAVADPSRTLTFAATDTRADRLAAALAARGVGTGDVVGVCLDRSVDLVVALLAVVKAGAAFLPINPEDPAERRAFLLADGGARAVVVDDGARPAGTGDLPLVEVSAPGAPGTTPLAPGAGARAVDPDGLAYVIYTSGTTGRPKGVQVEHRNLLNTLDACRQEFGFGPTDTGLVIAAHTFDVFLYELFAPLLSGGRARIVTTEELYDHERMAALLASADTFQAVPGVLEHLLTALATTGTRPATRLVMTGGDAVPPDLLERAAEAFPAAEVVVTYGPTETAVFCSLHRHRRGAPVPGRPIGRPLPGTRIRVGDDQGHPLPTGLEGELWISGAGVSRGYLNRPQETADRFRELPDGRYYRSGDRARRLPSGELVFLGRADSQVKVRGIRVELGEVETVLAAAPGVRAAVVVPAGGDTGGGRLDAYVVPGPPPADGAQAPHGSGRPHRTDAPVRPDGRSAAERTEHWRELFDNVYGSRSRTVHEGRDFTGWRSSLTGEPLPAEDLRDWLDGTLAAIRERFPRSAWHERRLRVLEIGCGTGLLLRALAPHCAAYVGTDFSARAVADLRAAVESDGLARVELHCLPADDPLPDLDGFDLVILNSVVQYFPDETYLRRVLDLAAGRLTAHGVLFVGDVRGLPLLDAFHAALLSHHGATAPERLRELAARHALDEEELAVHPLWFEQWRDGSLPGSVVELEPRRGERVNELTLYRFDAVILRRPDPAAPVEVDWRPWSAGWTEAVPTAAPQGPAGPLLGLTGVPNGPLRAELDRLHALAPASDRPAPDLPAGSPVQLHALRELAARTGHRLLTSLRRGGTDGSVDAVLLPTDDSPSPLIGWPAPPFGPGRLASDPGRAARHRDLLTAVDRHLTDRLPAHLRPSTVTVLDALPLSANGKVDRSALPEPTALTGGAPHERQPLRGAAQHAVAEVWQRVLGAEPPGPDSDFFTAGGTSLLAIRLAIGLRSRGYALVPREIFAHRTVAAIAAGLDGSGPQPAADWERPRPTARDRTAPGPLPASPGPGPDLWRESSGILLTGATGMLGAHLLHHLLERTDAPVTCLVRAADPEAAAERLRAQYSWYFRGAGTEFGHRVRTVAGDLAAPSLGLTPSRWSELARATDRILHAAADVRHVAEADEVFAVNTTGTRTLIALAEEAGGTRFHHVSTVGVAGRSPEAGDDRALTETDLDIGQRPTEAYSASKVAAERAVREYFGRSGPGSVFRIATVAPHWESGRFQRNADEHFLGRFLRATLDLGVAVDWPDRSFDLLPVDWLARTVLDLAARPEADRRTFHLTNPHRLGHRPLVEALRGLGYPIRLTSPAGLASALAAHGRAAGRLLPFLDRAEGAPVRVDSAWSDRWLQALGHAYPRPTADYVARFVARGVADGYLPAAPGAGGR
ncbi:amino acid adenylation domain-containing protein [Kitasatospora sp. NPDC056446]|uniref:non-ribosomal peptide synthetase family protein n=1 Tax=Kitasatospora sp. NPDC056446 TaxID=3345819 RepID=UPI003683E9DB